MRKLLVILVLLAALCAGQPFTAVDELALLAFQNGVGLLVQDILNKLSDSLAMTGEDAVPSLIAWQSVFCQSLMEVVETDGLVPVEIYRAIETYQTALLAIVESGFGLVVDDKIEAWAEAADNLRSINEELLLKVNELKRLVVESPRLGESGLYHVERIIDGDTIVCEGLGSVRVLSIDAPERREDGYEEARDRLVELLADGNVELRFTASTLRDRYGRLLAEVWIGDVNLGEELVQEGLAVDWREE